MAGSSDENHWRRSRFVALPATGVAFDSDGSLVSVDDFSDDLSVEFAKFERAFPLYGLVPSIMRWV